MQTEVYFSSLLEKTPKYQKDFETIKEVLYKHKVAYELIEGTKDIWARDYMPITNSKGALIQCRYEPSYLKNHLHLQTNPDEVRIDGKRVCETGLSVNLDGGNYVRKGKKVIISDRVFSENVKEDYSEKNNVRAASLNKVFAPLDSDRKRKLVRDLERFLEVEVIIIPAINAAYDMTGHSDGYVRFVNENLVLVNEFENEFQYFVKVCIQAFKKHNLDYIEMPTFYHDDKEHPNSAMGCYVNYLELDDLIIFPIFGIKPVLDDRALRLIKRVFPHKTIEPIIINDIAKQGGLMNCISWER